MLIKLSVKTQLLQDLSLSSCCNLCKTHAGTVSGSSFWGHKLCLLVDGSAIICSFGSRVVKI